MIFWVLSTGPLKAQQYPIALSHEQFPLEIARILSESSNQAAIGVGQSFTIAWTNLGADVRNKIIGETKLLFDKGYRVRPHMENYFAAVASAINDENLGGQTLTDYLNLTQRVIEEQTQKEAYDYFKTTRVFFESRALYKSKANALIVNNDQYRFAFIEAEIIEEVIPDPEPEPEEDFDNYDENDFEDWNEEETYEDDEWGTDWEDDYEDQPEEDLSLADILEEDVVTRVVSGPVIAFEQVDLSIITPYDTGIVRQAKGSFLILDQVFVGEKATFDWASAGLSPDSVFVEIGGFEMDVTKTHFEVSGVKLTYLGKLDTPIPGVFEFKPESARPVNKLSFPRFMSLESNVRVNNIGGPYFYYTGGFSLAGNKILSESKYRGMAEIRVDDAAGPKFKIQSFRFIFEDSIITAERASLVIYNHYDSIYHPAVRIKYDVNTKDLVIQRDKGGFRATPYVATVLDMNFTADIIRWNVEHDSLFISTLSARSEVPLLFQSNKYYDRNVFSDVSGLYDFNPLKLVIAYVDKEGVDDFYVDQLAEDKRIKLKILKGAMIELMQHGYVNYNVTSGKVSLTDKGMHKGQALEGDADYDNVVLFSKIASGSNAIMDLSTQELQINGVDKFYLAKVLDVSVKADSNRITMLPNRDIKFNGKLAAGNFDYVGRNFIFRYDSFLVEMNQIDSIQFYVLEENSRGTTRRKVDNALAGVPTEGLEVKLDQDQVSNSDSTAFDASVEVTDDQQFQSTMSSFSGTSGVLYISKPNNKSGKKLIPNYPKFKGGGTGSVVYFDRPEILGGVYDKSLYFSLPPFDLDSLSDSDPSAIRFSGTLFSNNWFPEFVEQLHIMSDYSLGFDHSIPPEGYQLFGGNGTLYKRLTLDKRGLVGHGSLDFLTSTMDSQDFIFYPDSVAAIGQNFVMNKEEFGGIVYPQISVNSFHMQWLPKKDSMYISNINDLFNLYDGAATLDGSTIVTNKGVNGIGTLLTYNSETNSTKYTFEPEKFSAHNAQFDIKSNNPEKPALSGDDVLVSFDMETKLAEISPEIAGVAAIGFPYAQFRTSITKAVWDLENQLVTMSKPEDVPIESSYFYTTREDLDSLNFNATDAEYNMTTLELKVSGIPFINVADAKITPENGEVLILENSRIGTLYNTSIILDTLYEYHEIYDATVTIISRNEFEGRGTYRFINSEKDTFAISLTDFHLETFTEGRRQKDESVHSVATGTVVAEDNLLISPGMFYQGNVKMIAHKPALELDGYVKLDLKSIPDYDTWIAYSSEAEQQEIVFKFDESVTSNGKLLSAGLHFDYNNFGLYSTFCYDKRDEQDEDFFKPSGFLRFKADSNEFVIISRDKDLGLSYSGKVFAYDENTRGIRFEGPVHFIDNSKSRAIIAAAIGYGNMGSTELSFNSFMTIDYDVPSSVFDLMATDFAKVIEEVGAPEAVEDRTELLYLMAEIIGDRATKAYEEKSNTAYTPITSASPNLIKPFVFSNLKFKWSEDQKAFYNDGYAGLSNVLRTDLNAYFETYFEIRKTETGEIINLFIKAAPGSWYYYSLENNRLLIYSSNTQQNDFVKGKTNIGKAKIGEFQFGPADLGEVLDFVNTFRAVYYDIDDPYELEGEIPLLEDEVPIETEDDEDDGFEEEDDGF